MYSNWIEIYCRFEISRAQKKQVQKYTNVMPVKTGEDQFRGKQYLTKEQGTSETTNVHTQ